MGISWHGSTVSVWRQTDTSSVNGVAPHAGTHLSANTNYIPFSQRSGLEELPPQLLVVELSRDLRLLIDYEIAKEIGRVEQYGPNGSYFDDNWIDVASDLHVKFFKEPFGGFRNSCLTIKEDLETFIFRSGIGPLFDLVEFFVRHPGCGVRFKGGLADAFVSARSAYRIVDQLIVAIGTEEQGAAFEAAIAAAHSVGASAARQHLVASGAALRNGAWTDSVRESVHAVESMARRIAPEANTLGPALKTLERNGYIHGSLKAAFEKLYGYTNDEDGIRHALSNEEARVDEVDALFMLGACSSFVSYLIAKETGRSETILTATGASQPYSQDLQAP